MQDCCGIYYDKDTELNLRQVTQAAKLYGLTPAINLATMVPYVELDNGHPIFLRTQNVTNSRTISTSGGSEKSYHALVLRGYNIGTNVYSIWNPWYEFYESMDMSTLIYITPGGTQYKWINTIHNW